MLADQNMPPLSAPTPKAASAGSIRRWWDAARQGALLYMLAEANGAVITGDFRQLPVVPSEIAERIDFNFERQDESGAIISGARGKVGRLLSGPILLVARDLGDTALIAGASRAFYGRWRSWGSSPPSPAGCLAAAQAARRAEDLADTARAVMAGDMTRRAPIRGVGDVTGPRGGDERHARSHRAADAHNAHGRRCDRARSALAADALSPQKLEAALDAPPNSEADREALRNAADEADRLVETFSAVLKLARVEGAGNWRMQRVNLTDVLKELVEFYEPVAEESGQSLTGRVADGLIVRGEMGLLAQAVSNLIENAMKYTGWRQGGVERRAPPDGRVETCRRQRLPACRRWIAIACWGGLCGWKRRARRRASAWG